MKQTKFIIASVAILVSAAGLFAGKLTGSEWVLALGTILGLYGVANVAAQKIGK